MSNGNQPPAPQWPWLPANVLETDDTGDDTLIYADLGGNAIRVLERHGRTVAVGDKIALRFPNETLHLFADGKRIELEAAPLPAGVA